MTVEEEISKRVALVRSTDPRNYEQLVRLMDQRVLEVTVAVTAAPPDQILVAQGRAQEAMKMFRIFTELPSNPEIAQPPRSPGLLP